jgi:outer membrane protein
VCFAQRFAGKVSGPIDGQLAVWSYPVVSCYRESGSTEAVRIRYKFGLLGDLVARLFGVTGWRVGALELAKAPILKRLRSHALIATQSAVAALALFAGSVVGGQSCAAETLLDALSAAYQYNPTLDQARAAQRATDESIAIANSGYRPDISTSSSVGRTGDWTERSAGNIHGVTTPRGYSINATQNIFTGFQTTNAVNAAEAQDRAGREILRQTEQTVLLDAVTAFADVVNGLAIVRLNEDNVKFLDAELKATQDRFNVGEVTKTDVAQAQARLALGQATLDQSRANLKTFRGNYEQVIGHPPSNLIKANPDTKLVPHSLDEAVAIGTKENPQVVQALYTEQQDRYLVDKTRGQLLPQAKLNASFTDNFEPQIGTNESTTAMVEGVLTVPLYPNGGADYAQIRQAKQTHIAALQGIEVARSAAQSLVVTAWSQLQGFKAKAESDRAAIAANTTALEGVKEEERVGQRTLLDVLNAQQELLTSQVNLEQDNRDILVASYAVVAAIGRLSVAEVGATSEVYDPEVNYEEVRSKWWGIDITHDDGRTEHIDVKNAAPPMKLMGNAGSSADRPR